MENKLTNAHQQAVLRRVSRQLNAVEQIASKPNIGYIMKTPGCEPELMAQGAVEVLAAGKREKRAAQNAIMEHIRREVIDLADSHPPHQRLLLDHIVE